MNLLGFIDDKTVKNPSSRLNPKGWKVRTAVRSVLFDNSGKVALLYLRNQGVYKIPGGGVKPSEDLPLALEREIAEETGCIAKTISELGAFVEHKKNFEMIQVSYCYTSEVVKHGTPDFTDKEIADGFELIWVDSLKEAIKITGKVKATGYNNQYMSTRDHEILNAAEDMMNPKG